MTPEDTAPTPGRGGVGGITGNVGTAVTDAQGPIHTGPGDQYNYGLLATEEMLRLVLSRPEGGRAGVGRGLITAEDVEWHAARFVRPSGFPEDPPGADWPWTQYFTGEPGSGLRGAALQWLRLAGEGRRPVRRLPDQDGDDSEPMLLAGSIEPGELLLLDTAVDDDARFSRLRRELAPYHESVEEAQARLAVVVSSEQERQLAGSARDRIVHIARPDCGEVLRAHLRPSGITDTEGVLREEKARTWLASATVGATADLASLIAQAKRDRHGQGSFRAWFDDAHKSILDWSESVGKQLEDCTSTAERVVLLAAAVCEGLRADHVFTATKDLMGRVEAPPPEEPPLERTGFVTLLRKLGVRLDEERRIEFEEFNYAEAVRNRFWDDFHDLHKVFALWIAKCVSQPDLTQHDRMNLADRIAKQCLRVHRLDLLLAAVKQWTIATAVHEAEAARVLGAALDDPHAQREVRHELYNWARNPDIPAPRARAAVAVCSGVLRYTHPFQAVVRLLHLARNPRRPVSEGAQQALVTGTRDRRFRRLALEQLTRRTSPNARDWELCALLTSPEAAGAVDGARGFPAGVRERDAFVACAAAAMRADREAARRHTVLWLDAVADDAGWRAMVPVLAESGWLGGREDTLYVTARDWVLAAEDRALRSDRRGVALELINEIKRLGSGGSNTAEPRSAGGPGEEEPDPDRGEDFQ